MAVGGIRQAGSDGVPTGGAGRIELASPLRRRVSRQVGPHPARSLAVRATGLGAVALAVGFYLGPEDGLVPVLVLAGIGGVLGLRAVRTVWARRTVGRRIRKVTGEQPVSLGAWRVGGSGYWLRPSLHDLAPDGPAGGGEPLLGIGLSTQGAELLWGTGAAAGRGSVSPAVVHPGPPVHWAPPQPARVPWVPPPQPARVPWVPLSAASPPRVPWVPPAAASPPTASATWDPTLAGTTPTAAWTTPDAFGWRRATSGIGPFAIGEEVEVLVTPDQVWVSGHLVERYPRAASSVEAVAADGLAITAGDGAIRRWVTLVPDDPRDLPWVSELLTGATPEEEPLQPELPVAPADPPAIPPERNAWDDPRSITDDGRRH